MELQTKTKLMLPVPLNEKRKVEIGARMSEVELLINSKEESKKAIAADYAEQIKNLESELYGLAKQFQDNAVNAEIDCRVDFNVPGKNQKTIVRLDTNEVVKVYDMSEAERKAFEEPELFDPQNTNFPLRVFAIYGIEVDKIFQPEDYGKNIFIVRSAEDLTEHEIDLDEDLVKDLQKCLAIRCNEAQSIQLLEIEAANENIKHLFLAEGAESEDLSWYFFPEINPEVKGETAEISNVTEVFYFDPETMDKEEIEDSYSADTLADKDKIRSHFEINDKKYVNTGGVSGERTEAYELVPAENYEGEIKGQKDLNPETGYEGRLITYRKKEYVLSNPIEITFKNDTEEKELEEYKLPEKEQ